MRFIAYPPLVLHVLLHSDDRTISGIERSLLENGGFAPGTSYLREILRYLTEEGFIRIDEAPTLDHPDGKRKFLFYAVTAKGMEKLTWVRKSIGAKE